jgi:hypothetical protein
MLRMARILAGILEGRFMRIKWIALLAVLSLLVVACGDDDTTPTTAGDSAGSATTAGSQLIDSDSVLVQGAVDEMVTAGIERDAAECYVTRMLAEFGVEEVLNADPSPETEARMLELIEVCGIDLEGVTGIDPTVVPDDFREIAQPRDQVDGPYTYGDDATLDGFWDACEAGSGDACDELYFGSPFGSEYEAYGYTCGNRPEVALDCTLLGG